jgi:glutathione S-transferase
MPEIILHHYPQSPVTEKVRVVLGIKFMDWHSIEIPRLPPKPDLMPLTGGYRRTPVMQIGADIYCDSQCIIRELERRYPDPTLFADAQQGLAWGLSRWLDGAVFNNAITVVLGSAKNLPEDFAADRGRLYFGPDFKLADLQAAVENTTAQLRSQFRWLETILADGRCYFSGTRPGLVDALVYYLAWFLQGRWSDGPTFLSQFIHLGKWQQRVRDIGHGNPVKMTATQALDIARGSTTTSQTHTDPGDPMGLTPGMNVNITPEGNGGDPVVQGEIVALRADQISIQRWHERVEDVVVHFPRVGYRIWKL